MNDFISWAPGITLEEVEKQVILKAMEFYRGNKSATARALGIAVRTIDNKLEKYENDGKVQADRDYERRVRQDIFLARQRGNLPTLHVSGATPGHLSGAHAGFRVEPTFETAAKSAVSVPQRPEVQAVLPQPTSKGSARKSS